MIVFQKTAQGIFHPLAPRRMSFAQQGIRLLGHMDDIQDQGEIGQIFFNLQL